MAENDDMEVGVCGVGSRGGKGSVCGLPDLTLLAMEERVYELENLFKRCASCESVSHGLDYSLSASLSAARGIFEQSI